MALGSSILIKIILGILTKLISINNKWLKVNYLIFKFKILGAMILIGSCGFCVYASLVVAATID